MKTAGGIAWTWRSAFVAAILLTVSCSESDHSVGTQAGRDESRMRSLAARSFAADLSVSESEADCLAGRLVATIEVPVEGAAEATELDAEVVQGLLQQAPSAVVGCVDLEERLAARLAGVDGELRPGCVERDDLGTWPLVEVLLGELGGAGTARRGTDLDALPPAGAAREQLLAAVEGCVSDQTLARLRGLDDPEALRAVLIADPMAGGYGPAQDRCLVDAVLDTLGVERLAEIGVTVEMPEFAGQEYRLDDAEHDAVREAMRSCDLRSWWRRTLDPRIEECVLDRITPDEEWAAIEFHLTGQDGNSLVAPGVAESACAAEATEQLYQPPDQVSAEIAGLVEYLRSRTAVSGVFEMQCFLAGIESTVTADQAKAHLRWASGEPLSPDLDVRLRESHLQVHEVATVCIRPHNRLWELLWEADIAAVDGPCLNYEFDEARLQEIMAAYGPAVWGADRAAAATLVDGLWDVGEAIEACDTEGRNYRERWLAFIEDLP